MAEKEIDQKAIEQATVLLKEMEELRPLLEKIYSKKNVLEKALSDAEDFETNYQNIAPSLNAKVQEVTDIATQASQIKDQVLLVEREISEKKGKVDSDTQTVDQTKVRFDELKRQAEELSAQLLSQQTSIQTQIADITAKQESVRLLEQQISGLHDNATVARDAAEVANSTIQSQQQTFQTSIDQTNIKMDQLNQLKSDLEAKIKDITQYQEDISDAYTELMTDKVDENGNLKERSAVGVIKEKRLFVETEAQAIADLHINQTSVFEKLYKELNEKINSLLPGAGAAGLASSYYEAKMRYTTMNDFADDENAKKIKQSKLMAQRTAYIFNILLFLVPLVIVYFTFKNFQFPEIFSDKPYAALFYKATVTLPLLGISVYGVIQAALNRRLYEEYNHKQRVMQLYHSFRREIESSEDNELKIKLLNIMLDVVKDKPSSKADARPRSIRVPMKTVQDMIGKVTDKVLG